MHSTVIPLPRPGTAAINAPIMEAKGLGYAYRGSHLIDQVSLAIQPGCCTTILGANGAGKSLLLRLMHGLLAPQSGDLIWKGRAMSRPDRQAQAMVFQRPIMLRRTVLGNLRFALSARGVRGYERKVRAEKALAQAGLSDFARHPARRLSGGEQQRLAIARALACAPELLFLDEPTASLDPASTQMIEAQILQARATGIAIVLVTHDLGQARRLSDRAAFLHRGRITEEGQAADILFSPTSEPARAWVDGRLYTDE